MYFSKLRAESDRLCKEHGLSVIEQPGKAKNLRNELYNVVRGDIDEAIRRTMTINQFYMTLKYWGYAVNDDPNRKYATIRPPGTQNRIRFKTLGEEYTPTVITQRILAHRPYIPPPSKPRVQRHYRYKGDFYYMQRMGGLCALLFVFILLLRKIRNHNRMPNHPPQRFTPELRAAVKQLERYADQTRLLCRHKLNTDADVTAFVAVRKQNISLLSREREKVYSHMKSAKTPESLAVLKSERDELSTQIAFYRKEVKTAQNVLTGWEDIRRKIQAQRELDRRWREREQSHQRTKARDYGAR
jgi:hypothetical protein